MHTTRFIKSNRKSNWNYSCPQSTSSPEKIPPSNRSIKRIAGESLPRLVFTSRNARGSTQSTNIWSVHVSDRDCPQLFTNGKGASKLAALASALGEFFERLSCNYFWSHYFLGEKFANSDLHPPPAGTLVLARRTTAMAAGTADT